MKIDPAFRLSTNVRVDTSKVELKQKEVRIGRSKNKVHSHRRKGQRIKKGLASGRD